MQYIFLVPFLVALYYVATGQREKAFLNVYLPCTFLLPSYYALRIQHSPLEFSATTALLPIGISLLFSSPHRPKFRRMDLWIILFVLSYAASEFLKEWDWRDAAFSVTNFALMEMFMAYVVGRMIIEPNLRIETAKRITSLILLLTPFVFIEFGLSKNIWLLLSQHLGLPGGGWFVQFRGGHARVAACFGDAILAGIVFMCAIAINFPLRQIYKTNKNRLGPWMSKFQEFHIPILLFIVFLLLTRSRAPMGCAVLCLIILQIPKYKNMRAATAVVLILLALSGTLIYYYLNKYTSTAEAYLSEEQSSAVYRRQMLVEYKPILDEGGWLGYGIYHHPRVGGLESIDNDYMLVQLSQGRLGLYLFVLIALESGWTAITYAIKFRSRESLFFVFGLLGALFGIFLSITTVYLGEQVQQILFLLIGWSQSLQDTDSEGTGPIEVTQSKFSFRRVFT